MWMCYNNTASWLCLMSAGHLFRSDELKRMSANTGCSTEMSIKEWRTIITLQRALLTYVFNIWGTGQWTNNMGRQHEPFIRSWKTNLEMDKQSSAFSEMESIFDTETLKPRICGFNYDCGWMLINNTFPKKYKNRLMFGKAWRSQTPGELPHNVSSCNGSRSVAPPGFSVSLIQIRSALRSASDQGGLITCIDRLAPISPHLVYALSKFHRNIIVHEQIIVLNLSATPKGITWCFHVAVPEWLWNWILAIFCSSLLPLLARFYVIILWLKWPSEQRTSQY